MKQKKEVEEKVRTRREYAKAGSRSQKMMSFRLDDELAEFLERQTNKGRFINELIRKAMDAEISSTHE